MSFDLHNPYIAQLSGIAVGLAISGAIFVNRAFAGLTVVLPDFPREEIQWGISGTSGEFFKALPAGTQELALNVLINALRKVYGTDPSYDFPFS